MPPANKDTKPLAPWKKEEPGKFEEAVSAGWKAILTVGQAVQESLPPPGEAVVEVLTKVTEFVETAKANHYNLKRLSQRAGELMDVIIEKHGPKEQESGRATKTGSPMYCQLMEKFRDLLDEILAYTEYYSGRKWYQKLWNTNKDKEHYEALVDNLAALLANAHFAVSVDTHTVVTDVQKMSAEIKGTLDVVRKQTQYQDPSEKVKRIVDEMGGISSVLDDDTKLDRVVSCLDAGEQIKVATLKKQARAGFMSLEAAMDEGIHNNIEHTDMRTFWRKFFKYLPEVDWDNWWDAFPKKLHVVVQDEAEARQVSDRLSKETDQLRFQEFVEKKNSNKIRVREVNEAFQCGISLVENVDRVLILQKEQQSNAPAPPVSSGHSLQQSSPAGKTGSFKLPKLEEPYAGRDQDALDLVDALQQQLVRISSICKAAVCIEAEAGMGKSSLGLDVGWRLAKAGLCPAGAAFVDLRGAFTFEAVIVRMCRALDVPLDEDAEQSIKSDLKSRQSDWRGPFLMLLDNTEDPICKDQGPKVADFLVEVAKHAMLLITSQVPVAANKGIHRHKLGSLDDATCQRLMRTFATKLTDSEVNQAVELCGGNPLLVRRAADALQTGQIVLKDLRGAVATCKDRTSAVLNLTLRTLSRQHQLQLANLSVFPSSFSVVGAAAVLGYDESRANGLLSTFYRHGLVMRSSGIKPFSLHAAVRKVSRDVGGQAAVMEGQARFVAHIFQQLDMWARIYFSSAWSAPLSMTREAGPDVIAALELAGIAQQSHPHQKDALHSIMAVDPILLDELLSDALNLHSPLLNNAPSLLSTGVWSKLKGLHGSTEGVESKAAALLLESMAAAGHRGYEAAAKAHHLYCQACGPDHPRSISCIYLMAEGQEHMGRHQEAETLFREAYRGMLRTPRDKGKLSPAAWKSLKGLADNIRKCQGRPAEATPLYLELLEVLRQEQALGDQHPFTLTIKNNLGLALQQLGKLEEAQGLMVDCAAAYNDALGPEHISSLVVMSNLADLLLKTAKLDEAEDCYQKIRANGQRSLGPDNPLVIDAVVSLASCSKARGKPAEAETLLRQRLEAYEHDHGALTKLTQEASDGQILMALETLGFLLAERGKMDGAEDCFRKILACMQRLLGSGDPRTINTRKSLAYCLKAQGKSEKLAEAVQPAH